MDGAVMPIRALVGALTAVAALGAAAPAGASPGPSDVDLATADRCDPIDPSRCLLPWPNDQFTVRDRHTKTGRRVNLDLRSMPVNSLGTPIAVSDYNYADGFSPGALIVTKVPGLDTPEAFERTGAVPITDLARTYDKRQPVVVINARTLRRQLIWAELDSTATSAEGTALLVRPAKNLREGERYIVALRRLRDAEGNVLKPGPGFRLYRDRVKTRSKPFERRRKHMESIFRSLRKAGIKRHDLYLAWDFTVASARSLSGRLRSIRDDAFGELGDRRLADLEVSGKSPPFTLDRVTDFAPCGADGCQDGESDELRRRVEGHVTVPCYLDQPGCPPGSRFRLDARGLPERIPGNTYEANFICNIPRSVDAAHPGRVALYGHGLFGGAGEVNSISRLQIATEHRVVLCATDMIGMSGGDLPNTITILQELSRFPTLADRLQQGIIDFLFLGRAMIHPDGFVANAAFRDAGGPLIDTRRLYYSGGSQGGIAGGAITAVAPDFTRAVLIVPAMNYSLLLTRSIDFDPFAALLYPRYPDELERPLLLSLIQMLWDRGEPNGYAWHMTRDPYPNTPRHTVLLHMAYGDHQVANIGTEVEARTIGARIRLPALDPGRSTDRVPFFGIEPIRRFPYSGSALVVWDTGPLRPAGCEAAGPPDCEGTGQPPITNTAPRLGQDPHGLTGREPLAQDQFASFIDGALIDVCGTAACHAAGWTGP
ncbi:MAG TPA: hypothetical protein VFQ12_10925 [Thermoleophilaceae bacterium]|nr:hypothetical protein [Thermoleophilaceae bacterium]